MDDIRALAREIYRQRVEDARRASPERKFFGGADAFDLACWASMIGIAHMHPEMDEAGHRRVLEDRFMQRRRRQMATSRENAA